MDPNPFTFLNQAIGQLLATNSPAIQTMGLDLFRGLAVIMIAWFGIQNALATAQRMTRMVRIRNAPAWRGFHRLSTFAGWRKQ